MIRAISRAKGPTQVCVRSELPVRRPQIRGFCANRPELTKRPYSTAETVSNLGGGMGRA